MTQIDDPFGAIARSRTDEVGVRVWDKKRATPGLVIFHTIIDNKIIAVDVNGDVVMRFDKTPGGYQLYRPGKAGDNRNIYCILKFKGAFSDRAIAALNEDGDIIWKTSHHHFTHDYHIRHNRRIMTVLRADRELDGFRVSDNVICEMDISGEISWQWSMLDNLTQFSIGDAIRETTLTYKNDNPFHVNSIQIADYPIVRKLLGEPAVVGSSRNMNSVFLIGLESGELLFEYSGHTMGQHHARVLPEIYPSAGNLIIVDNGYNFLPPNNKTGRGYSRIVEVTIPAGEVVWEYRSRNDQPLFYSPIVGAQQRFRNGNTLITEGYYGRVFEIDFAGNIVWDYVHPEVNDLETHLKSRRLEETGLRQIYRAYKVGYDWME